MQINPTLSHNLVSQKKEAILSGRFHCLHNTWTRKCVCLFEYKYIHTSHPCLCFILTQHILGGQIPLLSIWENGLKLFGNRLVELWGFAVYSFIIYWFLWWDGTGCQAVGLAHLISWVRIDEWLMSQISRTCFM